MVYGFGPERRNSITSEPALLLASMIACRKEPDPLSVLFRTVKVADAPTMGNRSTFVRKKREKRPENRPEVEFTSADSS